MKRKRYTTEQIIAILRQADTGKTVQEVYKNAIWMKCRVFP